MNAVSRRAFAFVGDVARPAAPRTSTPARFVNPASHVGKWGAFVDEGLSELLWSGVPLLIYVVAIVFLAAATPFAWLGLGARRALIVLRSSTSDKETA